LSSPLRISLAKANPVTAARLATLGRQTFLDTFGDEAPADDMAAFLDQTYGPDIQLAELRDPRHTYLLAEMQGQAVGYAKVWRDSPLGLSLTAADEPATSRLELKQLYVAQDWIGTGLGASLMRRVLELAQAEACRCVVLGVWEHNARAKAFYERFGFRQIGQHEFRICTNVSTDLILRKGLAGRAQD